MGLDLDQLGAVDVLEEDATLGEIELPTRPTLRFHGSIPALTEQLKNLMAAETRIVLAAAHQGDVERLATVLRDYEVPYRLGCSPARPGETLLDEVDLGTRDLQTVFAVKKEPGVDIRMCGGCGSPMSRARRRRRRRSPR